MMNLFLSINLFLITSILPVKETSRRKVDICNVYGSIYIETENRNRADLIVSIEQKDSFVDLKVFQQENQFYADKPGLWYFTKDRHQADYVIFIEKVKERAKYKIFYTDGEFNAGCGR
jgi:hypothetical protein